MRSRIIVAALAIALALLPAAAGAQDPDPTPYLTPACAAALTGQGDPVDVAGSTGEDGRCAIIHVGGLPAWAWLDGTISIACSRTGSGTSAVTDGFYLWGTTRDAGGAIVSQGYVGTTWTACGANGLATRSYHLQLALQGTDRTIALVVERRAWPFGASKALDVDLTRDYSGTIWIH